MYSDVLYSTIRKRSDDFQVQVDVIRFEELSRRFNRLRRSEACVGPKPREFLQLFCRFHEINANMNSRCSSGNEAANKENQFQNVFHSKAVSKLSVKGRTGHSIKIEYSILHGRKFYANCVSSKFDFD